MPFHDISMCERFRNAKEALTEGSGSLQQRLETVFATQLVCISPNEFPEHLRELAWSVSFYLTRKEATGSEGSIAATTALLSDADAARIATAIAALSGALDDYDDPESPTV
jgi:hypothetical protein